MTMLRARTTYPLVISIVLGGCAAKAGAPADAGTATQTVGGNSAETNNSATVDAGSAAANETMMASSGSPGAAGSSTATAPGSAANSGENAQGGQGGRGGQGGAGPVAGESAAEGGGNAAAGSGGAARGPERAAAGTSGAAASSAPAGSEGSLDSDGCPINLEGFASVGDESLSSGTTAGSAGETVTVTTQADLTMYAEADAPYVIRVQGAVKLAPKGTEIHLASNKTIVGVGAESAIVEGGFFLGEGVQNVIIRNLTISGTFVEDDWEGKTQDFDGVQMDTAHHVWIDHCHFHHIGDGIIDSRKDTTFLTVSWNILSDHNKAFGIGWTDNVTAQLTVHHNWLRDTNQRNPSTDNVLRAHLYNNWLQRIGSYGNYARGGTNMVLENSVFESVKDPHFYDTGSLVAIGNVYTDTSGKRDATGSTYDFFDPHTFYAYTLTPAAEVASLLQRCAGPRPTLPR